MEHHVDSYSEVQILPAIHRQEYEIATSEGTSTWTVTSKRPERKQTQLKNQSQKYPYNLGQTESKGKSEDRLSAPSENMTVEQNQDQFYGLGRNGFDDQNKDHSQSRDQIRTQGQDDDLFRCPVEACLANFESARLLKRHARARHVYCRFHELIFEDEEEYFKHRVRSPEHITCSTCCLDFNSKGGLKRHVLTSHPSTQNCECRGCGKLYSCASALMGHIENNECPKMAWEQFFKIYTKKSLLAGQITDELEEGPDVQDEKAFVNIECSKKDKRPAKIKAQITNAAVELDPESNVVNHDSMVENTTASLTIGEGLVDQKIAEDVPYRSLEPLEHLPPDKPSRMRRLGRMVWGENPMQRVNDIIEQKGTPPELNPFHEAFNVEMFQKKVRGDAGYACPNCSKKFAQARDLQSHMRSIAHYDWKAKCPQCFAGFKGAAALVSHMEATSFRCGIKDSEHFEDALEVATSGFIRHKKNVIVGPGARSFSVQHVFSGNEPTMT